MRFLADENCDIAVVRALRDAGHDVTMVKDRCRGAEDEAVAALALSEKRVLITEDKGFGQIAQALSAARIGVVLVRFPTDARSEIGATVVNAVAGMGEAFEGGVAVVEPGQFRVTRWES
ncbi:MAG: hypothetical protein A3D95_08145 [Betaproteobacteria bacterium RIFCSPHIGHO2_12_FULL_69_13]|nr:MAG: hypothetical protein A3D95_08145 [Betaproteobacteria bacterium RIFCSPHIGHO2_12_FULL_69_13]OGA67463.1 MAG: hypothetical protein A3G83_17790 [Betaproteobacteria bacterium RIFCSPLOWO2_12_FULL_68_20]